MDAYFANNMDPDQTAPLEAVWSGFIVFASMIKSSVKKHSKYVYVKRMTKILGG